jgi:DNA end-binding protein Ku
MPRALWKGAITFGLVHVPVALYPASRQDTLDFDWLDKRDMAPIGYRRINKQTGKEVERDNIVRGLEY